MNPNLVRTIFVSIALSFALSVGFSIPFTSTLTAFWIIYLVQIASVELAGGIAIARTWWTTIGRVTMALALFVGLRLIAAKFLGFYGVDAYGNIIRSGGIPGVIAGREPATNVMFEMLFAGIAGYVVAKRGSKWAQMIIGTIAVLAFVAVIVEGAYPEYHATWYTRHQISVALAKKGLMSRIADALPTGSAQAAAQTAAPVPTITLACGERYPRLPNVSGLVLVIPPSQGGCWTPVQLRPDGARSFWYDSSAPVKIRRYFADGEKDEIEDSPLVRKPAHKFITALQFRNDSDELVTVKMTF